MTEKKRSSPILDEWRRAWWKRSAKNTPGTFDESLSIKCPWGMLIYCNYTEIGAASALGGHAQNLAQFDGPASTRRFQRGLDHGDRGAAIFAADGWRASIQDVVYKSLNLCIKGFQA